LPILGTESKTVVPELLLRPVVLVSNVVILVFIIVMFDLVTVPVTLTDPGTLIFGIGKLLPVRVVMVGPESVPVTAKFGCIVSQTLCMLLNMLYRAYPLCMMYGSLLCDQLR